MIGNDIPIDPRALPTNHQGLFQVHRSRADRRLEMVTSDDVLKFRNQFEDEGRTTDRQPHDQASVKASVQDRDGGGPHRAESMRHCATDPRHRKTGEGYVHACPPSAPVFPELHHKPGSGKSGLSMAFKRIMERAGIPAGVIRERRGAAGRSV
jgi:hypothetical protein